MEASGSWFVLMSRSKTHVLVWYGIGWLGLVLFIVCILFENPYDIHSNFGFLVYVENSVFIDENGNAFLF